MQRPLFLVILVACGGREAARVELEVATDAAALAPVRTREGHQVELDRARLSLADLEFCVGGEAARAPLDRALETLVPLAHAHPGHSQGGEVTGELRGRVVALYERGAPEPAPMGVAELLVGSYRSGNFRYAPALESDGLEPSDPLLGHSVVLSGRALLPSGSVPFEARVALSGEVAGAPFEAAVGAATRGLLALRLLPAAGGSTLFDGVDFEALASEPARPVLIAESAPSAAAREALETVARALESHDHFEWQLRP